MTRTNARAPIAKVRGVAVGAGLNLALGCDLIAAASTARFSEIFAKRGLLFVLCDRTNDHAELARL